MKILVINGSPKAEGSITLQTVKYLELKFPELSFEVLHAGARINALAKDFSAAKERAEKQSDSIKITEKIRDNLKLLIIASEEPLPSFLSGRVIGRNPEYIPLLFLQGFFFLLLFRCGDSKL